MNVVPRPTLPFGLMELDARGTVIRYSPAGEERSDLQAGDVLGRNFFQDVVPVEEVSEFQHSFQAFMAEGESIQRFTSTFPSELGQIKVQILMALVKQKTEARRERLALVRLMPEELGRIA